MEEIKTILLKKDHLLKVDEILSHQFDGLLMLTAGTLATLIDDPATDNAIFRTIPKRQGGFYAVKLPKVCTARMKQDPAALTFTSYASVRHIILFNWEPTKLITEGVPGVLHKKFQSLYDAYNFFYV